MRISLAAIALVALCALPAACKQRESDWDAGPSPFDAGSRSVPDGGRDGATDMSGAGGAGLKPLALGCSANTECASGFCVDGVCCDSTCDGQCSACNLTGSAGYCTGQPFGDDTSSAQTCNGAHTCAIAIPSLNLPACRLKTLQACKTNSDCASFLCQTFYVDHDGDGYGETDTTLNLCEVDGATPPVGYATQGGDCCDSDPRAFPGQTNYFGAEDACVSWDYSCDGKVVSQNGASIQNCGQYVEQGDSSQHDPVYCH